MLPRPAITWTPMRRTSVDSPGPTFERDGSRRRSGMKAMAEGNMTELKPSEKTLRHTGLAWSRGPTGYVHLGPVSAQSMCSSLSPPGRNHQAPLPSRICRDD
jgi:hypothetical protein